MADERDLELLDEYLTNRLSEQDRSAFEQKLQADPDLSNEYMLQQRLVKGIQDARVAELKSMLNKIPVSASGPEKTLASKMAVGAVVTLLVATAAYWYFNQDQATKIAQPEVPVKEQASEEKPLIPQAESHPTAEPGKETPPPLETDKNQTSAGTESSKSSQSPVTTPQEKTNKDQSPVLDKSDPPTEENEKQNARVVNPNNSSLIVETDKVNSRYSFHYQFSGRKIFLYGPFEKNQYKIIEFFSDENHTIFLHYKDNYYLLEKRDATVRPLTPITDEALLKKLREYRIND